MLSFVFFGAASFVIGLVLRSAKIKRNYFFGYRTFASMKSEASWSLANKTAGIQLVFIGVFSLLFGIACYTFNWLGAEFVIFYNACTNSY